MWQATEIHFLIPLKFRQAAEIEGCYAFHWLIKCKLATFLGSSPVFHYIKSPFISKENKPIDYWTNQLRDLTQSTSDQTQIILLQTHMENTLMLRKVGKKEKRMTRGKVTVVLGAPLENLKNQVRIQLSLRKSMRSLRVNNELMGYNRLL